MNKTEKILKYALLSTSLFLILPNKIREVPFAILGFITIIIYLKSKIFKKRDLLLFSFFIINILSIIYTKDIKQGLSKIEGLLPFFYLSVAFLVFRKKYNIGYKIIEWWILVFNISNLIFLLIFLFFHFYTFHNFTYNDIRTSLDTMPLINIHPIYLSIIGVLGVFIFLKFKKGKIIDFLFLLNYIIFLYLSGVRATLIVLPLLTIIYVILLEKKGVFKFKLLLFALLSLSALYLFNTDFKRRFNEIKDPKSYLNVNIHNSTSIRYAIWDCSISQMKSSNLFFGEGIGDVKVLLLNCYDSKYPELNKYYNTHNQFFFIFLTTGILGLISFILTIIFVYRESMASDNKFLILTLFFYFYMFNFENILERKYGILIFLFFIFFIFNLFLRSKKEELQNLT
jgi:O-antigen ligase